MSRGRTLADRLLDPALAANAAIVLAFVFAPVAVIAVFSFTASNAALAPPRSSYCR